MNIGGSFSFAQLWKTPILVFLIIVIVKNGYYIARFVKTNILMIMGLYFCPELLVNPLDVFVYASKLLPLPLFFTYLGSFVKEKYLLIEDALYIIAQFIALSSTLTLLGIVTPLKEWSDALLFGDDIFYYTSVFGMPHPASSYFCISILVLLNGFRIKRFVTKIQKVFNAILIVIGLISIFEAYVRTGWLMLIVGVLILYKPAQLTPSGIKKLAVCGTILFSAVLLLYQTNDMFRSRIAGHNVELSSEAELETNGSGRDQFWQNGIELWATGNVYQIIFGHGTTKVVENNRNKVGIAVGSHNLFIDMLSKYGLLGLSLLLLMYYQIYRYIRSTDSISKYKPLAYSAFAGVLVFSFFQSEIYFIYALIFAIILSLLKYEVVGPGSM